MSTHPTITAFERSPDGGRGLARDMRVRWSLEEVGQRYNVRPVSFAAMKEEAHRRLQPFGQIPTYEEADVTLFGLGASHRGARGPARGVSEPPCLSCALPRAAGLQEGDRRPTPRHRRPSP
jgi:hypothetical protein